MWNFDWHADRCHVLWHISAPKPYWFLQGGGILSSRYWDICRMSQYDNVYRIGIRSYRQYRRLAVGAGLSKGLKDKSEQVLLDGFSSDLSHDGALSSQVLITEAQEVVDHKCCRVTIWKRIGILVEEDSDFAALPKLHSIIHSRLARLKKKDFILQSQIR